MSTHNICFLEGEMLLISTHNLCFLEGKMLLISTHNICFLEGKMLSVSIHNICFHGEIRKIIIYEPKEERKALMSFANSEGPGLQICALTSSVFMNSVSRQQKP